MSKSPIHPKHESSDCSCYEFDPRVNFSQFLEEAKHHARNVYLQRSHSCSEGAGKTILGTEKKSKKSWRNSLFSWCKIDRKSKPGSDPVNVPNISKPMKRYISSPLCRTVKGVEVETPRRRPQSPPFSPLQGRWRMRYLT